MNTEGTVIILFLCFLTLFSSTDCTECHNVLEGDTLTFVLVDGNNPLANNDRFTVKKDNTIIVRKRSRTETGPGTIVDGHSLKLHPMKISDSGTYTVEVYDDKGTSKKAYSKTYCVYAKVQKPILNITCLETKVAIRCEVKGDNVTFEKWHKNGKEILKEINFNTVLEDTSEYTCTTKNPVHNNTSKPLRVACAMKLFGFDFWIMVGILAGGGSLVLFLVLVMVVCSCRACKRREKQHRDEEELRLNYHNLSQSQQKSKQTARGQPAPPEPYDDVSAQDIPSQAQPKPRNQPRGRPPPPPIDDDEEQPPPLPQPRKNAQVKGHEEP